MNIKWNDAKIRENKTPEAARDGVIAGVPWGVAREVAHSDDTAFYCSTIQGRIKAMASYIGARMEEDADGIAVGYGDEFNPSARLRMAVWVEVDEPAKEAKPAKEAQPVKEPVSAASKP